MSIEDLFRAAASAGRTHKPEIQSGSPAYLRSRVEVEHQLVIDSKATENRIAGIPVRTNLHLQRGAWAIVSGGDVVAFGTIDE